MMINSKYPIVECVINLSEGRDHSIIKAVQEVLNCTGKVHLVNTDVGYDVNRTVFTIIGILEDLFNVLERLFLYSEKTFDIKAHKGTHPRIGILDVIPFIPIENIDVQNLSQQVKQFSKKIGTKMGLPIFYYGRLSENSNQQTLAQLRRQNLRQSMHEEEPSMIPDEGPLNFHNNLGASCVTVRDYMVAFNINLDEPNWHRAKKLAKTLRKNRSEKRDVREINLEQVRFLAWYMPKYGCHQISMNLYDINQVDLLSLYRYIEKVAYRQKVKLCGSELIGVTPISAICKPEEDIDQAIEYLGLNSVKPFSKEKHTLDAILRRLKWAF